MSTIWEARAPNHVCRTAHKKRAQFLSTSYEHNAAAADEVRVDNGDSNVDGRRTSC